MADPTVTYAKQSTDPSLPVVTTPGGAVPLGATVYFDSDGVTPITVTKANRHPVALSDAQLAALAPAESVEVSNLPPDPATATLQEAGNESLDAISDALADVATQTTLALIKAKTDNLDTALSGIKAGTDKLIASPATEAKQDAGNTSLASIDAKMSTLAGYVDTLESLIATTNAGLTTLQGYVDGLENLVGTTNSTLTTIDGRVDGLEALLTALNGYADGLEGLIATTNSTLATVAGYVDTVETLLAAATPAGANIIGKVGIDQTTPGTTNAVALTPVKAGRSTLAQLTATGNTASASVSGYRAACFSVKHVNGTGSITVGATVQPQVSFDGTNWVNDGGAFAFGTTASATEYRTYVPPGDGLTLSAVRFVYTSPTGSTGHTLDVEYGRGS